MKGYRYDSQVSMFGEGNVIGFGSDDFYIEEISWGKAKKIIIKNHYSHKVDSRPHNKINLGVFINGLIKGCLQFGYAMNPASMDEIVKGTKLDEYLELNRMWIEDNVGMCPESRAISYAIKYIKRKYPKIKWIQSFADERCNGLGVVYQACSFNYYGCHVSTFWEFEGEIYHNSRITNGKRAKKQQLKDSGFWEKAKKQEFKQFRYIKFIDKRCKKMCLLKEEPYPKRIC